VDLSDGDWIEIKERLTYGEERRLAGGAMHRVSGTDEKNAGVDLDFELFSLRKMETWLADWSFIGKNGKQIPVSRSAIATLDSATAREIDEAITAHAELVEAESNPNAIDEMIKNHQQAIVDLETAKNARKPANNASSS
jgi:hypothetical protein